MSSPGLALLQQDAYAAVCRAFYAQDALRWDQEELLSKLRDSFNISNQLHMSITQEARNDADVVAVRSGGMPKRLGRTSTGVAGIAPAPSIGAGVQGYAGAHAPPQPYAPYPAAQAMPPPPQRQRAPAAPAPSVDQHSVGSPGDSDFSIDSELTRQRSQRSAGKKAGGGKKRGGGGGGGGGSARKAAKPSGGGGGMQTRADRAGGGMSLQQQASMRRAPSSRPVAAAAAAMPRVPSTGLARARSTRQNGSGLDPLGYVGRRLWRNWPAENPPWVEGFINAYDMDSDTYTIVYDPNTKEASEEPNFDFARAVEGVDYVIGEYVDITAASGSKRQYDVPWVPPEALSVPPPPGLLATLAPAPSKKRKSTSGAPVPADAPFEMTYLSARLPVAAEDELQQMLAVLERKERIVEAEISMLEYQEANREDIEERQKLEQRFAELCEREATLMAEMAALQREAAAAAQVPA